MDQAATLKLGERTVGDDSPTFVLAEIASAHQGQADMAMALARVASEAKADGVKFQLFRADALIAPNDSRYDTFRQIELSVEAWHRVLSEAERLSLPLIADVFDEASLEIAEAHDFVAYKIHFTDLENPELIKAVAATGKPILLGTGGVEPVALAQAILWVQEVAGNRWMPMHGVQNFPTRLEDSGLHALAQLRHRYGRPVGFLDHVDGASPEALQLPALAVVAGADLVEKHITLDRSAQGFDYESALEKEALVEMIDSIRRAEQALGPRRLARPAEAGLGDAHSRYHRLMRRSALAARPLEAGHILNRDDVVYLRHARGLAPSTMRQHFGRRLASPLAAFDPISAEHFEAGE